MSLILCKVYAALHPATPSCREAVAEAAAGTMEPHEPWLFLEKDVLRIAFEGLYFPLDEVLLALEKALPREAEGKLDYLDLEDWTLVRCAFAAGRFTRSRPRDLNQVLDHSGF
jgi:hypothetical protein